MIGRMSNLRLAPLLIVVALLAACASKPPVNPSFDVSEKDAQADLKRMRRKPIQLDRPVVVIGGWGDPLGIPPSRVARQLRELTGDSRVIGVSMGGLVTFDGARNRTVAAVQRYFPSADPGATTEVDVIGFSMGGLVARDAARPPDEGSEAQRSLRIARLFTISTPHRGAASAILPMGPLVSDMKANSDFLKALADASRDATYVSHHYVRLGDSIVGPENAAPPGETAWWVASPALQTAHAHAYKDPRIMADIARRLRGEVPFSTHPPAALPTGE